MSKIIYRIFELIALMGCLIYLNSRGITFWGGVTVMLTAVIWKVGGYMEDRR